MAMELAIGGGGGVGGSGGDDHHDQPSDPNRDKKRYHRHTAEQIQLLEATFKECPHPDEKMRLQLSRELGLNPRQIKFWFQNRRTQLKAKSEMADNCLLRVENDKIRSENIAIKEALKNALCITCGGPPVAQDHLLEEQRLRFENAHLKEELDRVSGIAAKFMGRPLSLFAPAAVPPSHLSALDLSMASYVGGTQHQMIPVASGSGGPSLDLDLFTTTGMAAQPPTIHPSHPLRPTDKSIVVDIATAAMDELLKLFQTDEPLWTKSAVDGRNVLEIDTYERIFPRPNTSIKNPHLWIEGSRASGDVMMHSMQLVDMFADSTKWADLFPTIVSKARTIEVISSGVFGDQSRSLQLMYEELQVVSPLVPIRQFLFIRYIQQIEPETWAVVDHLEIEEKTAVHRLYRDLIYSGLAFGAERWVACLQRSCERIVCQMVTNSNSSVRELGGVIPSADGKKIVMNLAQRMVNNFCTSIVPSSGHLGTSVSDFDDFEVHMALYKSSDPSQANTMVLAVATTVWMPFSPQFVFDFLRNESNRHQWDVLTNHNPVQEVTHIANGAHPGNCISLLRTQNTSQTNILILQESCTDSSGSLVVYCPVDLPVINIALSGEDPLYVPLLPSGFAITTDGRQSSTTSPATGDSSGQNPTAGSLVTLMVQSVIGGPAWGKLGPESMTTINNLMGNTIRQIKAGLNCSSTTI
ncbi:Homeobox, conserved site-containing protein [Cynara cardunculus var. scolymus]|uniref:Homeobox, conserved site-containing protein n=1 Tax=Cynara cardunculus var. scolymus TaxID=59895 RepID=A0A118K4P4_CYNCS|nr:Homeobox, conserved site-containing protein [Cynara cardunculus var. scolymus]